MRSKVPVIPDHDILYLNHEISEEKVDNLVHNYVERLLSNGVEKHLTLAVFPLRYAARVYEY